MAFYSTMGENDDVTLITYQKVWIFWQFESGIKKLASDKVVKKDKNKEIHQNPSKLIYQLTFGEIHQLCIL